MFSCLQILEAFLWFVLITLLNVTLIILTLSVSRLLNLLLRLVAFLLFLNPQCLASISRWITASSIGEDRKSGSAGMPRPISTLFPYTTLFRSIEALKPAIEACGISTLSQSPMLGFHKQMDNRIKHWGRSEERFSRNAETDIDTLSLHDALPIYRGS